MGESSEINVYHNKDIIDRLERLETWWKFLPTPGMYNDIIRIYNDIKDKLSQYLRKDQDDTISGVITFQKMPQIPDTGTDLNDIIKLQYLELRLEKYLHKNLAATITGFYSFETMPYVPDWRMGGNENDLVKKKYLDETKQYYDEILKHCVRNDENQLLHNDFTFTGRIYYTSQPVYDYEPALNGQIQELRNEKLTKTPTSALQIVEPKVQFNDDVTFTDSVTFTKPIENATFIGEIPHYIDTDGVDSRLLSETVWENNRYRFYAHYPYIDDKDITEPPTRDVELVTKKYVDDQISSHVIPSDVARKTVQNNFSATNLFSERVNFYGLTSIMSRGSGDHGRLLQVGYAHPGTTPDYDFPQPESYAEGDYAYSDYINEYYYSHHTLLKDSDERQDVEGIVNFKNILVKGNEIETLTPKQTEVLKTLENMLIYPTQLRLNDIAILADTHPKRNLDVLFDNNLSYSIYPFFLNDYSDGVTSSVLGGIYRLSKDQPRYELLGVLERIKDDPANDKFQDIVDLMTYSLEIGNDYPPMVNHGVGMWVSGIRCKSDWDNDRDQLESVHTILGYVKPDKYNDITDNSLDIQPVFSKVTCTPFETSYKSGLMYSKGHLWDGDTLNENVEVTRYALYSEGITSHPQKSLSNSDFSTILGYLDWSTEDKLIHYEGSSFYSKISDVAIKDNLQSFFITSNDGFIKWDSSTYTNDSYEKELSLKGSHSKNEYDLYHRFLNNQNTSDLKIYKSLNEYDLYILQREGHEDWYPLKFIGFKSSISVNHKDTAGAKELTSTLEDKIGFYGGMVSTDLAEYSRCLLQSSYTEHHFCNDLYQNVINDKIELGHYNSALSIPEILYFNVLQNTLSTTLSYSKQTRLLTREAFSGSITEYQADPNLPSFATIKWNGYPYTIYSNRNAPNSKMYSLYFNNYTIEDIDDNEIASISTFYNYDPLIEYATQFNYQFKQRKFVFSMLPDPSRSKDPMIYAEIIGDTSSSNGSLISLNARTVSAPYIDVPSDIKTISDLSIINGKIIKKVIENAEEKIIELNTTVIGHTSQITEIFKELNRCPHLSTIADPIYRPFRGSLLLWRESTAGSPDISMYSPNWSSGITTGARTDIITYSNGAWPNSTAYVDFQITDLAQRDPTTAILRLSSTSRYYEPATEGYLHFIDCKNITHLVANKDTTDAIRFENKTTETTYDLPHPFLVKDTDSSYRLEFRDASNQVIALILLNTPTP